MRKESVANVLWVSILLCLVCSVLVSTAAIKLRPLQLANAQQDIYKNILSVTGLYTPEQTVSEQFARQVEMRVVRLSTGEFVDAQFEGQTSVETAAMALSNQQDIAKIKKLPDYVRVYLVRKEGQLSKVVLPVYGYGLWSTLYGFLALQADGNTVYGLKFYSHAETPGLGGEVDNPKWQQLWRGKKIYNAQGEPALEVIKGKVSAQGNGANESYQVDGLSGATITSKGVSHLIRFWTDQMGYKKFLNKVQTKEIT